jgi:hypothetical protein
MQECKMRDARVQNAGCKSAKCGMQECKMRDARVQKNISQKIGSIFSLKDRKYFLSKRSEVFSLKKIGSIFSQKDRSIVFKKSEVFSLKNRKYFL